MEVNSLDFSRTADALKEAAQNETKEGLPSNLIAHLVTGFNRLNTSGQMTEMRDCIRCLSNACAVYELEAREAFLPLLPHIAAFLENQEQWMVCAAFILNLTIDFGTISFVLTAL